MGLEFNKLMTPAEEMVTKMRRAAVTEEVCIILIVISIFAYICRYHIYANIYSYC